MIKRMRRVVFLAAAIGFLTGMWVRPSLAGDMKCSYFEKAVNCPRCNANTLVKCDGFTEIELIRNDQKVKSIQFEVLLASRETRTVTLENPQEPFFKYLDGRGLKVKPGSELGLAAQKAGIQDLAQIIEASPTNFTADESMPLYKDFHAKIPAQKSAASAPTSSEPRCVYVSPPQVMELKWSPSQGCGAFPKICTAEVSCFEGGFKARAACVSKEKGTLSECPSATECAQASDVALSEAVISERASGAANKSGRGQNAGGQANSAR